MRSYIYSKQDVLYVGTCMPKIHPVDFDTDLRNEEEVEKIEYKRINQLSSFGKALLGKLAFQTSCNLEW